jgi:hypothetical protein
MEAAAIVAVGLLSVVEVFQIALALGAPFGSAAWGGRHPGILPKRLRIGSAVAAVVYPVIAVAILGYSGVIEVSPPGTGRVVMWVFAGLFTLGTVANVASRSMPERYWALVSSGIAICCAIIASSL